MRLCIKIGCHFILWFEKKKVTGDAWVHFGRVVAISVCAWCGGWWGGPFRRRVRSNRIPGTSSFEPWRLERGEGGK